MNYKHILVAVDLSKSSDIIIRKTIAIAKLSQAKVSFIFVDLPHPVNNVDLNFDEYQFTTIEPDLELNKTHRKQLQDLADTTNYDIENCFYLTGDLAKKIQAEVKEINADLLVCGHHHHTFWNGFLSPTRKIVDSSTSDLFIVQV